MLNPSVSTAWSSEPLTSGNPTLKGLSAKNILPEGLGQNVPEVLRDSAARQEESQKVMWLSRKEQEGEYPKCVYYFSCARMF